MRWRIGMRRYKKKDEALDRVGGRICATKSDLLSKKIVCGVIRVEC